MKYRTTHARLASGLKRVYYYTDPGGSKFWTNDGGPVSRPYSGAFKSAYAEAVAGEDQPYAGDLDRFIGEYLDSALFQGKSRRTQENHRKYLANAAEVFGDASAKIIEDRRFRGAVIRWQESFASKRAADLHVLALSVALGYAVSRGLLARNPCKQVKPLYEPPGNKQPWSAEDEKAYLDGATATERRVFEVARNTGLRRNDLAGLTWAAWMGDHIEWRTSKSRRKRVAIIPLTDAGRSCLARIRDDQDASRLGRQRTILTGERGRSLTPDAIGHIVNDRCKAAGLTVSLHQLRNTFACDLVERDFSDDEIAGIMGWSIEDVQEMKRIYVGRDRLVAQQVRRLRGR